MNKLKVIMTNLYEKDDYGNTLLHNAIINRNTNEIMNLLKIIEKENETEVLNIQNNNGDTPLHLSVKKLPLNSISNLIIGMGADTTIENNMGQVVEIADTLKEYFENSKYSVELSPYNDEWDCQTITIVEDAASKPLKDLSVTSNSETNEFPSDLTIEEIPKPQLVPPITSQVNQDSTEQNIQLFLENLLKSKKLN